MFTKIDRQLFMKTDRQMFLSCFNNRPSAGSASSIWVSICWICWVSRWYDLLQMLTKADGPADVFEPHNRNRCPHNSQARAFCHAWPILLFFPAPPLYPLLPSNNAIGNDMYNREN